MQLLHRFVVRDVLVVCQAVDNCMDSSCRGQHCVRPGVSSLGRKNSSHSRCSVFKGIV